ncbi:hypothetical protein CBR_g48984 [Chara braunii]|uniref:Nucleoside diphosphate kinase-like domain-containing protein n=1 Tax=Chara braunii TaxID=69332 RepID=A0A388M453_CHABU|nr:hypothetical protein CBR_g48984 [Chara braunii]|eukprot:GBG89275.1 hypothetical protein CBR_g48984 [Chara braunii]
MTICSDRIYHRVFCVVGLYLFVGLAVLDATAILLSNPATERCPEADHDESYQKDITLAIVKPDAFLAAHVDDIRQEILHAGLQIKAEGEFVLDKASAELFYREHKNRNFFPHLVSFMSSGPVYVMLLSGRDAIKKWRLMIGPTDPEKARKDSPLSIRARFGTDNTRNAVHGSDSHESVLREMGFFFGNYTEESRTPADACQPVTVQDHPDEL